MDSKKNSIRLSVCDDFNRRPGLRTRDITPGNSGEDFYHQLLNKKFYEAITSGSELVVDLDRTAGYPPSFIDETFGRLVYDFGESLVRKNLILVSTEEEVWKETVEKSTIPAWESRRSKGRYPQVTKGYQPGPWWHMQSDGTFVQITDYNQCK